MRRVHEEKREIIEVPAEIVSRAGKEVREAKMRMSAMQAEKPRAVSQARVDGSSFN
ncbi:hypothetical protein SOVF_161480 isoform B [Spinacia oleracea]|nr:hypothetical protein SOVF_161480 isoform B [Spinacia oleracea]